MKKVGILYHPKVEATIVKAGELEKQISSMGISAWVCSAWEQEQACGLLDGTELVITVGGDGTILRAVQVVIPAMTPITGVNLGKLGFMTEMDADETTDRLPALLGGDGWIDERTMLRAEISAAGQESRVFHALNDVVVARGEIARVIRIDVSIDGSYMTTFNTDGVIISTATGSTGYAMAAGGPVLYPRSEDMLLVPVAPHLNPISPLVLAGTSTVELRLNTYHAATISIDGHINMPLAGDAVVTVTRSQYKARFRRIRPENSFYGDLQAKLKGKQGDSGRKS